MKTYTKYSETLRISDEQKIWVTDFAEGIPRLAVSHCVICTVNKILHALNPLPTSAGGNVGTSESVGIRSASGKVAWSGLMASKHTSGIRQWY